MPDGFYFEINLRYQILIILRLSEAKALPRHRARLGLEACSPRG